MIVAPLNLVAAPDDPHIQQIGGIEIRNIAEWIGQGKYAYRVWDTLPNGIKRECTGTIAHHAYGQGATALIAAVLADVQSKDWLST